MIHQAYTEMLQSAIIKESEKVTRKSDKKEKISERKGGKQKTLESEYGKRDDKQANLDNTQSRKRVP